MPADTGEKTEAPTPKRLQEAREKGQVSRSADLTAAVGLLAGLVVLNIYGASILRGFMDIMEKCLTLDNVPITGQITADEGWRTLLATMASLVGPLFLILVIVAIVINILQVGFVLTSKPITPSFEKISILSGFKRLFSQRTAMRMVMNLAKVGVIATAAWITIKNYLPALVGVSELAFTKVVAVGSQMMFMLGVRLAGILLILALIDFAYQKYKGYQDLRMSKEEVKEELKRMEGDPIMRSRRRQVARQLAAQRMSQAVPTADVVVTNPTHLAIALKYDQSSMHSPKVVAKGAGYIAMRIREIANENNIPVVERKPLAQALFKSCEIGDYIPPELYKAVAEVLAYVFELAGRGFRRSVATAGAR